jgi:beta-glucanase (GH16 family)
MEKARSARIYFGLCLLIIGIAVLLAAPAKSEDIHLDGVLQNGQFNIKNSNGSLQGWVPLLSTEKIDIGSDHVTVHNDSAGNISGLSQKISVKPEWSRMLVRGNVRVNTKDSKAAAEVSMQWLDVHGKQMQPIEPQPASNSAQWTNINCLLDVPKGAVSLVISLQLGGGVGDVDFQNFRVNAWILTFDDEFNGTNIDTSNWIILEGPHYYNEGENEWFDPAHVKITDGNLIIHTDTTPHRDYQGSYNYESGDILSRGKFQQLYGYFEFRAKVPMTPGVWPADVLLSWNDSWPPEIDVQELCAEQMGRIIETNHYSDDAGVHKAGGPNFEIGSIDRKEWHTYAVAWEPNSVSWYIDGKYTGDVRQPYADMSHVPMYITINTATGGWGGDPSRGTWPQDFITDYVHVYQRNDIPLPVYAKEFQEITWPQKTAILSAIAPQPNTGAVATWSLSEGPGKAAIENPHSLQTNVTFSGPGMYRFRITVSNGSESSADEQLIYVNRPL